MILLKCFLSLKKHRASLTKGSLCFRLAANCGGFSYMTNGADLLKIPDEFKVKKYMGVEIWM
jgi:hypothetical protein